MGKVSKENKIQTYDDLKRFILATLDAHGNMISTNEAAIAIEKAFVEFRESFSDRWQESITNLSQYF